MPSKKVLCSNPFGEEKHKKFGWNIVSGETAQKVEKLKLPLEIEAGNKLCVGCHFKVKSEIKKKIKSEGKPRGRPKKRVADSTQSPPAASSSKQDKKFN